MSKPKNKNNHKSDKKPKSENYKFLNTPVTYLIFGALIFVLYFRILGFPMGKLDEDAIITNNLPYITEFSNISHSFSLGAYFNTGGILFYRPMQNLTFFIDAMVSGGNLWGFYLFNIIYHFLTCIGIFVLLKKFGFEKLTAFFSVLIFAVNPLFTHSIAWIPSRGDILLGLFGVFWFISWMKFNETKNYLYLAFSSLLLLGTMFSKESAIVFPGIPVIYILLNEKDRKNWKKHITAIAVFACCSVLYYLVRNSVVNAASSGDIFGLSILFRNLQIFPELFGKFFIPVLLAPMPGFSIGSTSIGLILMIGFSWLVYKSDKQQRILLLFAVGWFAAGIFPGMLFSRDVNEHAYHYLEHRGYMPSIGLTIILGSIFSLVFANQANKPKISILAGLFILVFMLLSFVRTDHYKTGMAFYDYAIEANPKSVIALTNRGIMKNLNGDKEGAVKDFLKAVEVKPDYFDAYNNAGTTFTDLKKHKEALDCFNKSLAIKPDYSTAYFNRGSLYKDIGELQKAIADYKESIKLTPSFAEAYVNLGNVYKMLGDMPNARSILDQAVKVNPKLVNAWQSRAVIKFHSGDFKGAIADYEQAIILDPKNPLLYMDLGATCLQCQEFEKASRNLTSALSLNSNLTDAYFYRAICHQNLGKSSEMCADLKIAASMGNTNAANMMNQLCK